MSKVTSIIDSLSHNARLMKELAGKGTAEKTEILIRETRGQIADEVLSKNASDAVRASVTPQIKIANKKLAPDILKAVEESQAKIERLGIVVDEEAQKLTARNIELSNKFNRACCYTDEKKILEEMSKLRKEIITKGYDSEIGYTPFKFSAQTDEALFNIVNEYRPKSGTMNGFYEKALQILKERGVM